MLVNEGKQLEEYLDSKAITVIEFAEKLGITKQSVYDNIKRKVFTRPFRHKLTQFGIDVIGNEKSAKVKIDTENGVPYYDVDASAGPISVFNDKRELPTTIINIPGFEDCDFWINCFGDSMAPKYSAGDIVACKEVEKKFVAFGETFMIRLRDGNRYIKYIRKHSDPSLWILASENQSFESFDVAIDDVSNVWIIKGKIKKNMI